MKDREDIIRFIKDNQIAVIAASAALIAVLVYAVFFAPLTNKLNIKYKDCRTCETRAAEARGIIELGKNIDKEYGSRALITEQQAAVGIEEFTRYGKSLGVKFISIKPHDIIKPDSVSYKILPLEMTFESSGEQFVKFIGTIDELKRAIVKVKKVDINPDMGDRSKLAVDMIIDIYLSAQPSKQ